MSVEILDPAGDVPGLVTALRTLIPAGASVSEPVAEIIADVRDRGDAAVREHTRRLDTAGHAPLPFPVPENLLVAAEAALTPELRGAIELAATNIAAVARTGIVEDRVCELPTGSIILREAPVDSAAVYVPGGRAPYPSTALMGLVTARAAGVPRVVVCAPPGPSGEINPVVLAVCAIAGADAVYRMGGAQSIAALAYGTKTIAPVDVIVGPGNLYVQEAKRQVFGKVGIDSFAGPSDLLVIADAGTPVEPVALDLLAQAEHGDGTLVVAASTSRDLLGALALAVGPEADRGAEIALIHLRHPDDALTLAQSFAPEHLELIGPESEALAPACTHAGCVFVGLPAGTAFGDYVAGSNHILPTDGAARFASALSARSFRRTFTEVRVSDPATLARAAGPLARAEGFELHARSMEARIRENRVI